MAHLAHLAHLPHLSHLRKTEGAFGRFHCAFRVKPVVHTLTHNHSLNFIELGPSRVPIAHHDWNC